MALKKNIYPNVQKKKMFITILLPFDKIFEVRWYFFFKSNPKLLNIKSEK